MKTRLAPLLLLCLCLCLSTSCSDDTVRVDLGPGPSFDAALDAPLPDRSPRGDATASMIIGVGGGRVLSTDGLLEMEIPAGALSKETEITISKTAEVPAGAVGEVGYDIGPEGMVFNEAVTITISYSPANLGGAAETSLKIAVVEKATWQALPGSKPNPPEDKVSAPIAHLSIYGIISQPEGCGNSLKDGSEECDGSDLGGQSCAGLGFEGGTLACLPSCQLDQAGCWKCGDGKVGGGEACDGSDLGGKSCATQGFDGGTLACQADCSLDTSGCHDCGDGKLGGSEACDGSDLGGKSCLSLGFESGALACKADCSFDTAGCLKCGDGKIGGSEACDGGDLGGKSCLSQGFEGGTLACKTDCSLDTTACYKCGDGVAAGPELCDLGDLRGQSCLSSGFEAGTLSCTSSCTLDTSGCRTCGDGKLSPGELCDGTLLGSSTCQSLGFDGGNLPCTAGCTHDTSSCRKCGDGKLSLGEVCDGSLHTQTCQSLGYEAGGLLCTSSCSFDTSFCFNYPPIIIAPSTVSVIRLGTTSFSASGGTGSGYTFSLSANNSGGNITAQGLYTAGPTSGVTDTVRVADSLGHSANATVSVLPTLTISPAAPSVAPLSSISFAASGGSGSGYTFTLPTNNSGGSITTAGIYTAGSSGGVSDTVHLVDSLGNPADAVVTVLPPLAYSPAPPLVVASGAQQQLTASGGSGSYSWAITTSNSGGNISTTGLYTAGSTGSVEDTIVLTDTVTSSTLTIPVTVSTVLINETFSNASLTGWTLGGTAALTGTGLPSDPVGSGWLRLTPAGTHEVGWGYASQTFNLSRPIRIDLDFIAWDTTQYEGADGIAVSLFDAAVAFSAGADGAALGYANDTNHPGMAGAYAAVGAAEYKDTLWATNTPNSVGVLGSAPTYTPLGWGNTANLFWFNQPYRPENLESYRHLRVLITPAPNPTVSVWVTYGTTTLQLISNVALPAISTTKLLKLALTGSTGYFNANHEVRNLTVVAY